MTTTTTKLRIPVGSTAQRGACDECGMICELHLVREGGQIRELCLPHALGAEPLPPLPKLALRRAAA